MYIIQWKNDPQKAGVTGLWGLESASVKAGTQPRPERLQSPGFPVICPPKAKSNAKLFNQLFGQLFLSQLSSSFFSCSFFKNGNTSFPSTRLHVRGRYVFKAGTGFTSVLCLCFPFLPVQATVSVPPIHPGEHFTAIALLTAPNLETSHNQHKVTEENF